MKTRRANSGRHSRAAIVLALLAAGGLAVPAAAQDEWTQQVRRLIQEGGKRFEESGYSLTHRIYTGALDGGESETVTLDLNIGTTYQIMGACDTDCSDLDATLYDGAGNQIDSDLLDDDFPIVSVTPSRSGSFSLRVAMVRCSAEPCRYGVGVFGR